LRVPARRRIRIAPMTTQYGDYELKILTRTDQIKEIKTPLPRELWIEVTGPAPSIEVALGIAASSADHYARQVAFGANAWQGLLSVHLAYESTPGHRQRMFFQNWIRDEIGLPRVARDIDPDLMFRLLAAITQLTEKDIARVLRAIMQYTDALQHWKIGNELYALAHLYMGVEAITPTAIRWEVNRRGLKDPKELETAVHGPPADSLKLRIASYLYRRAGGYIPSRLDPWARREIIFCGDKKTYYTAKNASDQFEHGLSHHQELQQLAAKCVERTAAYLRSAILNYIPLTDDDRTSLKEKPYAKPLSASGFERQLLATIACGEDEIAAPDQAYPIVRWAFNLKDFRLADDGGQHMRVTQTVTPRIGKNAKFKLSKIHFAGPGETTHAEVEIETDQKESDVKAGVGFLVDEPTTTKWIQPLGRFILNCNTVRYLSLAWIKQLTGEAASSSDSFAQVVERISEIVSQDGVRDELQEQCQSAWREAIQFDEVRTLLSGSAAIPDGLVSIDKRCDGKAPLAADISKLTELNDKTVQLAQKLRDLLDELLGLEVFSRRTGNE